MSKKQPSFLNNWTDIGSPDSGIVRESNTGREGERKIVALDPLFDPKNEQFVYNYRKETKLPFVNAYGSEVLQLEKPPKGASKDKEVKDPYNHIAVITQRIPHRLVDAPQLTYPESLYVLDRSLEGFETAYEKCGPMRVNDRLIGFNNQGECKVWVNEDFANNHPSYPRRRLMSTRADSRQVLEGDGNIPYTSTDESDMVQDVVDTVENYSEEGRFPEPFASRIHQRNLSFSDARRLVHETITQGRIPVPNRVDLFTNRVRGFRKTTNTTNYGQQQTTTTNYGQQQGNYGQQQGNYGQQQTTTTTHTYQPATTTTYTQQPVTTTQVIQQPVTTTTQVIQQPVTTTQVVQPSHGYRFNYLPVDQPFKPDIFASRLGEHGVYRGRAY